MRHVWTLSLITCALAGGLVSCGGGGAAATSSSNTPALPAVRTTGFSLPSEVSPVSTGTSSAKTGASLFRSLVAPSPAVYSDAGTDYSNAQTVKYVSEHAIDQFAIIETILNAVSQTHYADAENINAGPYKSIVSWQQSNGSGQSKTVQTWIVDSSLVKVNGQDVNQVDAWIEDSGQVIRAKLMISASANQAADGSYLDYGVWTLNVKFDQAGTQYFAAEAYFDANGDSVVAINQLQQNGGSNTPQTSKAVMHKSATSGYGKVFYPDQNQNTPVQTRASYVYDAGQLLVHQTLPGPGSLTYQDRTQSVEITSQYGLYDSVTGADVMTTHSFGFPVSFTAGGATQYAYYGANQGQQQLWVNGGASVPDGTQVTRQDQGANGATYQTASFNGTLIKRTYVAAQLSDA